MRARITSRAGPAAAIVATLAILVLAQTPVGVDALRGVGLVSTPEAFVELYFSDPTAGREPIASGVEDVTVDFTVAARGAPADVTWRVDVGRGRGGVGTDSGVVRLSADEARTVSRTLSASCGTGQDRIRVRVGLEPTNQEIVTWVPCDVSERA